MDISNFMSWFVSQCVSIFGDVYNTLDSITFLGTSLLKFSITILILGSVIGVLFTLSQSMVVNSERSGHLRGSHMQEKEKAKQAKKSNYHGSGNGRWI